MKTTEKILCTACDAGHYEEVFVPYETTVADGTKIVIPKVKFLRCSKCGDELIPPETQREIDRAISEQTEQLSIRELELAAETFGLDQTEISEILGLGSKTFHRWLKGKQYPSRSMGFYIRILVEFPEVFEWLKERAWHKRNRISQTNVLNLSVKFPDLAAITNMDQQLNSLDQGVFLETEGERFNPVTSFTRTKIL